VGETTAIAWTDHTLNPWTRCTKVSPGCFNCYAATWANRATRPKGGLPVWGPDAPRDETKRWLQNLRKWDQVAALEGVRRRVFCASLADVFEDHPAIADGTRASLFDALRMADSLDVQLLTKRPENVTRMVPPAWLVSWPAHVWIGTTVEDQQRAEERIPHLLRVPAAVRFLSVEPMLGPVDLDEAGAFAWKDAEGSCGRCGASWSYRDEREQEHRERDGHICPPGFGGSVSWVICGGESGPKARPFDLAWARSLRDQCKAAGTAFFMKQGLRGCDLDEIPADLHVREFPHGT
jgi:protein gp37